jgi:hypothetical protein
MTTPHSYFAMLGNAPSNLSAQATQALASQPDASLVRTLASMQQPLNQPGALDCPSVFDDMLNALKPALNDVDLWAANEMVAYLTRSWL